MTAPYTASYTAKNAIQQTRSVPLYSSYTAAIQCCIVYSYTALYSIQPTHPPSGRSVVASTSSLMPIAHRSAQRGFLFIRHILAALDHSLLATNSRMHSLSYANTSQTMNHTDTSCHAVASARRPVRQRSSRRPTTAVSATVGGKRMGEEALWST